MASFDGARLRIVCDVVRGDASVDDSIAVNGVCLTVVEKLPDGLGFDISDETRDRTSLSHLHDGAPVNLERPLTLATRLGGHLVQGHVDGIGEVVSLSTNEVGATLQLRLPQDLMRYVVDKGSITVDGVSLTVGGRTSDGCSIALIPHTLSVTTLGSVTTGAIVNIEVDIIAKYVEASLRNGGTT